MSEPALSPYSITTRAQQAAADPANSAFVAANAGSDKTRVLTNRVARLLLADETPPQKILCITFTKAAAAEMSKRLFDMLGEWALASNADLEKALRKLEGGAARTRNQEELGRARRLFARALETPGGLKIQTIHSFCESVLKRFPLEAGIAPGFSVLEDSEAAGLAADAVDKIAADALGDAKSALRRLAARRQPDELRDLLIRNTVSRQKLESSVEATGGWREMINATAGALSVRVDLNETNALKDAVAVVDPEKLKEVQTVFFQGLKTAQAYASGPIQSFLTAADNEARFEALSALFLNSRSEPRQKFGDSATKKISASASDYLVEASSMFIDAIERVNAARILADTSAFFAVLKETCALYDALKFSRAALDYDDLISRTRRLFIERDDAAWVLFRLDQGLDHILLDEAQDTSPAQWSVIEGPLREFFAGESARAARRTFFAVGDQKQSIYSFQGADASVFQEKRIALAKEISAVSDYVEEPLTLSFRTTAPVLAFIDSLFAEKEACKGLWEDDLSHGVHRMGESGLVELWPLTPAAPKTSPHPWDAPLDSLAPDSPARQLAGKIASTIANWIERSEALSSKGRAISPGDILILVQSRGPLFHEVIRALGEKGVAVAGADRLELLTDPAIEDILAYARVVLLETDDLSLAEVLKSPFFGLNEDALFSLAYGRNTSLWRALTKRSCNDPTYAEIVRRVRVAKSVAAKEGAFAFITHILEAGVPSGRSRLCGRLGQASQEAIDELLRQTLDYELKAPRSLQGFVTWFTAHAGEIKREMDQAGDAARVMTVHGAKGLEAPIVFLVDAHRPPNTRYLGPLFDLVSDDRKEPRSPGIYALASTSSSDSAGVASARSRAKRLHYEEYRRLLYVAATRAEDRLYICGIEHGNQKNPESRPIAEKTWHALALDAFNRLEGVEETSQEEWGGSILRIQSKQTIKLDQIKIAPEIILQAPPKWLGSPAAPERAPERLSPSRLADHEEATLETAAFSPARSTEKFLRGRTLHRLLELLPSIAEGARPAAADRLLARLAPDIALDERARWRAEALKVLADPAFSPVFSPNSRAEVAVAGAPKGVRSGFVISGQIDRLSVEDGRVLIVDFKTNRPPPQRIEDAAPAYIAQLAAYRALLQEIYPGHEIATALLWTYEARLMPVPAAMLDHAFARWLA